MFGALLGAVAPAIVGGLFKKSGASKQNSANSAQAQQQMDFQERMSNTQYQRGMSDMKAAGLNPMLAYQQGGAGTPAGAQAQMQNENEGIDNALSNATATALQYKQTKAQVNQMQENAALATAQANTQKDLQSKIGLEKRVLKQTEHATILDNIDRSLNNAVKKANLKAALNTGKTKSAVPELQYIDILTRSLGNVFGAGNSALDLYKRSK